MLLWALFALGFVAWTLESTWFLLRHIPSANFLAGSILISASPASAAHYFC